MSKINFLDLQKQFDRTKEWNDAGYTGKGVTVWNMEGFSDHGLQTRQRVYDAAPEATVINTVHEIATKKGVVTNETVYYENLRMPADMFIKQYDISILTQSKGGSGKSVAAKIPLYHQLRTENNLVIFNSAGNDGEEGISGNLPESEAFYIGACMAFAGDLNDLRMCGYSSVGEEFEQVDFSTFTRQGQAGTSFAAPYLAGITALLKQRYGKDFKSEEVYQYYKMIARPILTENKISDVYDLWSGYGIPILPKVDKRLIRMVIGETAFKVDNDIYNMDVAPIIHLQRTFVPIAFVALALGAKVAWDKKDRSVAIAKDDKLVQMWIGNEFYHIDGEVYHMDVAPFIRNSRTLVPITFVAEALGCKVGWVNNLREVLILEG